ncbi:MAG: TIGR03032 family protein, partial [Rhodospirillales bacterium]|nr:TIGR03032 family protein [Rhodospirillales bacterium]
ADERNQTLAQERIVGSAMGLAVGPDDLWISNKEQAWRFANVGPRAVGEWSADAVYMPRKGYFLGPCDTHDILANVNFDGRRHELLFVNTNFSCIAAIDDHYNFRPVWKPDFISAIAPGDRCHLNGMGTRDGELAFATLCGRHDTSFGWKQAKDGGGMVVDINRDEVLCQGLSMPHSPRWHDGQLWLLNSGDGDIGYVESGRFVSIGLCPGFARGLCFVGGLAVISISKLRENTFAAGLKIKKRLEEKNIREICGLLIVNPNTGKMVHWLTLEGPVTELYDVAFIPGVHRPFTPGFSHPEMHRALLTLPEEDGLPVILPELRVKLEAGKEKSGLP